tara:strand:- start:42574 stop:42960 length:387 start_codon:yes stop_codon:yes gene_type:complete
MPKNRKIVIPDDLSKYLGIEEKVVNEKMQEIVNRRAAQPDNEMFIEVDIAKDYLELFTLGEMVAMFMHAASNAGYLEWKIMELLDKANIPLPLFQKIMADALPTDEEVAKAYRKEGDTSMPEEDEDFI